MIWVGERYFFVSEFVLIMLFDDRLCWFQWVPERSISTVVHCDLDYDDSYVLLVGQYLPHAVFELSWFLLFLSIKSCALRQPEAYLM